jgi:hypothetical protein
MSLGTAITAAVIGTVGSIAAAKIGSDASSNAAKTQSTAGTTAANTFQPYQAGAMNAYNKASAMFGLPPQAVPSPGPAQGGAGAVNAQGQTVATMQLPGNAQYGTFQPANGPTPVGAQAGLQAPPAYSLASFLPPGAKPTTGSSFGG